MSRCGQPARCQYVPRDAASSAHSEDEKTARTRAFKLTNALLETGKVVELNVIAGRLALAHERIMPAMYALRRRRPASEISDAAREALDFISANVTASSGEIRHLPRAEGQRRPDAADLALAGLQRELLVDRGPPVGPSKGAFYLSRDGYPYRIFATSHPEIVASARNLGRQGRSATVDNLFCGGTLRDSPQSLAMFQLLVSIEDINESL